MIKANHRFKFQDNNLINNYNYLSNSKILIQEIKNLTNNYNYLTNSQTIK